jgi:hypothetical protein
VSPHPWRFELELSPVISNSSVSLHHTRCVTPHPGPLTWGEGQPLRVVAKTRWVTERIALRSSLEPKIENSGLDRACRVGAQPQCGTRRKKAVGTTLFPFTTCPNTIGHPLFGPFSFFGTDQPTSYLICHLHGRVRFSGSGRLTRSQCTYPRNRLNAPGIPMEICGCGEVYPIDQGDLCSRQRHRVQKKQYPLDLVD